MLGTRVLPVRIHDLDTADIKLCESVLGGMLRGVDFVYKAAGVNRPLRANEDRPQDNLNKTYYRDQINKVANAIDDIFRSLKSERQIARKEEIPPGNGTEIKPKNERKKRYSSLILTRKSKTRFILLY